MTRPRAGGFTLIELLIVVAIIGLIAAIAIPGLVRARVSANEAATIGDIRSVLSAEQTYATTNAGFFGTITCLGQPAGCLVGPPPFVGPAFMDRSVAQPTLIKSGYKRTWLEADAIAPWLPTVGLGSVGTWAYVATPVAAARTGVRGFSGSFAGSICFTPDGTPPPTAGSCSVLN